MGRKNQLERYISLLQSDQRIKLIIENDNNLVLNLDGYIQAMQEIDVTKRMLKQQPSKDSNQTIAKLQTLFVAGEKKIYKLFNEMTFKFNSSVSS